MRSLLIKFLIILSLVSLGTIGVQRMHPQPVYAENADEKLQRLRSEIEKYEKEITRLQSQVTTLSNQIAQYDAQIRLTLLQIEETQEKIDMLSGRIDRLEVSLQSLTDAFSSRAKESYMMSRLSDTVLYVFSAKSLDGAVSRFHYLQRIQEADRDLMMRLQEAQNVYSGEKESQEELQSRLQVQKEVLDGQKAAKKNLLVVTRNDERRYQSLLAAAKSEFVAIQAILAGQGDESEVGKVSKGSRIASIISGASCNSSGSHLHFIIRKGESALNPFAYLKSGVSVENCSGSSCGSSDGDSFSPSGSWDWPINSPIKFTQGYGSTWATKNTWVGRVYSFHNGIDIGGSDATVKAVQSGTLYRGSYSGSSGCKLRYVRVEHDDSDIDTLYLHINY